MDVWSWICQLTNSDNWSESGPPLVYELASSKSTGGNPTQSIQLTAQRTAESNSDHQWVTFSVCLRGFDEVENNLWVSDACPLFSDKPFVPLVQQLLQETISRSPTAHDSASGGRPPPKLRVDPVSWITDSSYPPGSFGTFFNLVFLTRLFWLCACDAPSEVGSFYFKAVLAPNLAALSCGHEPVLRAFLVSAGVDAELCFMRTIGYMLVKWFILRNVSAGLGSLVPAAAVTDHSLGFAYAANGLWVMRGYAPVLSMKGGDRNGFGFPICGAKGSALKYALAHQQLEAVIQLEYSVQSYDGHVQLTARVDNLRFHVAKLGFSSCDESTEYGEERYYPSRVRVWVGPEIGSAYVSGLSLGRSTDNAGREVETQRVVRGRFGKSKLPAVKATARTATKTRTRNWRWDQEAEGNAAVFDATLYGGASGAEVATWKASSGGGGGGGDDGEPGTGFRRPCAGANRAFTKTGGLVFAGDEYGQPVTWRLSRDVEHSVVNWRMGAHVWVSYLPNDANNSYHETRSVKWSYDFDFPVVPRK